jgi:hypothetical protein
MSDQGSAPAAPRRHGRELRIAGSGIVVTALVAAILVRQPRGPRHGPAAVPAEPPQRLPSGAAVVALAKLPGESGTWVNDRRKYHEHTDGHLIPGHTAGGSESFGPVGVVYD